VSESWAPNRLILLLRVLRLHSDNTSFKNYDLINTDFLILVDITIK
jgi:hypothetical protein